eukprot:8664742-Pyramimonas_sp.AAC.1
MPAFCKFTPRQRVRLLAAFARPRAAPRKMHAFLEEKLGQRFPWNSANAALRARASTLSTRQFRDIALLS